MAITKKQKLTKDEHDAIHAGKNVIKDYVGVKSPHRQYEIPSDGIIMAMERVDRLSLPCWSEVVKKSGEWSLIFKRYGCEYLLSFVIDDKDKNWISLWINHKNNKKPKFAVLWSSELTQENYAEACEIIKKIWENK